MANYNSYYRTNYFKVSDPVSFKEEFRRVSAEDVELWDEGNGVFGFGGFGSIDGLIMPNTVYGTWRSPCSGEIYGMTNEVIDYEDYDYDDLDYDAFLKMLQDHLVEGDAVILTEVGYEKLRYLTGQATVVTKDKISFMNLTDLAFEKAKEMLGNKDWTTKMEY